MTKTTQINQEKHLEKCPKCGSTYLIPKPHIYAPEGQTTIYCGICENWWYEPK